MLKRKGFTLVELLVVVAIIAILSVVGMTIFTGVQKSARDAKRRADIDAISKAFEVKYDYLTGKYRRPSDSDYAAGEPKPPEGGTYNILPVDQDTSFRACATLDDKTTYCKVGARGTAASASPPCAKFNSLTVGQSQTCRAPPTSNTSGSIYIKCAEIPITPPATLDCNASTSICTYLPNGNQITILSYDSTTALNNSGTFVPVSTLCTQSQFATYTVILRD